MEQPAKVIGIIAEYNPFHGGHKFQIKEAKKRTGADWCVAAMSGDFVQRGEPAVYSKYLRTRMALSCGADLVVEQLSQTLPALGFEFIVEEVSFNEMLSDYYRENGERKYNMNFMATNFANAFDPYYTFITDPSVQGSTNTSGIVDEELMELAWDMHVTYPGQYLTYEQNWLEFITRFNEILPTMPIYSNIYFDFFTDWLQNYEPATYYSWPVAILYAYYAEPEEPVEVTPLPGEEETEAPAGDDEIIIID